MGYDSFSLSGKRLLVTGGGAGIGAAICRAATDAGATVAVNDLDPGRAVDVASSIGGASVPGHVATEAGAATLVAEAVAELGGLDRLGAC